MLASRLSIPQPFSRWLISLCSSLFEFNSMKMEFCSQKIEIFLFVITNMAAVMSRATDESDLGTVQSRLKYMLENPMSIRAPSLR